MPARNTLITVIGGAIAVLAAVFTLWLDVQALGQSATDWRNWALLCLAILLVIPVAILVKRVVGPVHRNMNRREIDGHPVHGTVIAKLVRPDRLAVRDLLGVELPEARGAATLITMMSPASDGQYILAVHETDAGPRYEIGLMGSKDRTHGEWRPKAIERIEPFTAGFIEGGPGLLIAGDGPSLELHTDDAEGLRQCLERGRAPIS